MFIVLSCLGIVSARGMSPSGATAKTMEEFARTADMSWMRDLNVDPEHARHAPNNFSREVKSGHYVPFYSNKGTLHRFQLLSNQKSMKPKLKLLTPNYM